MRRLYLLFKNADGSRKQLVVEHCHQELSAEVVYQAMVEISQLELFERDGVRLYTEIVGAKYVEKRVTVLFDDTQPPSANPRVKSAIAPQEIKSNVTLIPETFLPSAEKPNPRFHRRLGNPIKIVLVINSLYSYYKELLYQRLFFYRRNLGAVF